MCVCVFLIMSYPPHSSRSRSDLHPLPLPPDLLETPCPPGFPLKTDGPCGHRRGRGEGRFDGVHLPVGVHARRAGSAGGWMIRRLRGERGRDSWQPRVYLPLLVELDACGEVV